MKNKFQLSDEDIEQYQMNGFFIARSLLSNSEISLYQEAIAEIMREEAWRLRQPTGYDKVFIQVHNVWKRSKTLRVLTLDPDIARIACLLEKMSCIRVFMDQVLYKQPNASSVNPHQDAPYLSFTDERAINCWIAIDNVTSANGALSYFIGSHRLGATRLVHLDQEDNLIQDFPDLSKFQIVSVNTNAGDAIFHNCHTVHAAFANITQQPRRAYSIQYMPDGSLYNGWAHEFLKKFSPKIGEPLVQDCFPIVYSIDE